MEKNVALVVFSCPLGPGLIACIDSIICVKFTPFHLAMCRGVTKTHQIHLSSWFQQPGVCHLDLEPYLEASCGRTRLRCQGEWHLSDGAQGTKRIQMGICSHDYRMACCPAVQCWQALDTLVLRPGAKWTEPRCLCPATYMIDHVTQVAADKKGARQNRMFWLDNSLLVGRGSCSGEQ